MARLRREDLISRAPRRAGLRVPERLERLLSAGIVSDDPPVRRRQLFTNIVAFILAGNALFHLVANALYDFEGLLIVHLYNGVIAVFCLLNNRLHAHGDLVAAIVLILGVVAGHTFIVFMLGTASDLQIYFTLAGFVLFLVGVENFRIFLALYAFTAAALLIAFFLAPPQGYVLVADIDLRRSLSFEALVTAYVMNGVLISFTLVALYRAERALFAEHERSEALLTTILPPRIAERLKASHDRRIADRVADCSVLFTDLVGFTEATSRLEPEAVVAWLDQMFSRFDAACERHGVDKIKTIGDSYMVVGGLASDPTEGARAIGLVALDFLEIMETAPALGDASMQMRIGIHAGPVTAGVIGDIRMSYDVWGDTVNIASRMESHGLPGRIHVSDAYRALTAPWFAFEPRGAIEVKSLGMRLTHLLIGRHEDAADAAPPPRSTVPRRTV